MWEHKANTGSKDPEKWKENMKQLCAFNTVEDFWQYFTHLPKPSEVFFDGDCRKKLSEAVPAAADADAAAEAESSTDSPPPAAAASPDGGKTVEEYSLFKKGIEPEWGDPQNVTGGEWFCRQYFEGDVLDLYWKNLVMACIGETIEDAVDDGTGSFENHINGARVVDKSRHYPLYKIELWLKTRDPVIKERIKNKLIELITELGDGQSMMSSRKMTPKFDWRDHSA
ncbi:MAG: hypothetical protein SGARI_006990 [Bacillariaceae sp.]